MKYKLLLILVIAVLISCSRKTNEEAETYFNSGKSKAKLKDYRGAIEDFSKAIAIDSTYAAAYYYRGDARELMPMAEADSAMAANPSSAEAFFRRGNAKAYLEVAFYAGTGEGFTYVVSLNKTALVEDIEDDFGYVRGSKYLKLHREAIKDFNKATELDSTFWKIYKDRRIGEASRPDYKGAIEDYNKAIELDPKYTDAHHCRGCAKYEMKDYRGAIEDYNGAINLDPGVNPGLTEEDYNKAIELDPAFAGAYYGRGIEAWPWGDENGLEDIKKAIALDPKYGTYYNPQDEAFAEQAAKSKYFAEQEQTQNKEDLERLNEEIKNDPENGDAYSKRADIKVLLDDYRGAIEDCNKAINLDPGVRLNLIKEEYDEAIELDPTFAGAYFVRGFTKANDSPGDYRGAVEDFDKVIELDPQFSMAYYHRGLAKVALRPQKDTGCSDLQKALELGYEKASEAIKNYCN